MIVKCRFCKSDSCGSCETSEVGQIEILWNGRIAMRAEVSICKHCAGGWLVTSGGGIFLCRACRHRAMHVEIHVNDRLEQHVKAIAARGAA